MRPSCSAAVVVVAAALATSDPAAAAPCDREVAAHLFTARFAVVPAPGRDDGLGVELRSRGPGGAWGDGCTGVRHHVELTDVEIAHAGTAVHLGGYRVQWNAGGASVHLGARVVTLWDDAPRFVTPVAGVALEPVAELLVRAEVASAGVFLIAPGDHPTAARDDLSLQLDAAYPASAATRAELRVRARRHRFDDATLDDVTVTAGAGLALAGRDRQRALPGFLGVAARRDAAGDLRVFLVAELAFGLADR